MTKTEWNRQVRQLISNIKYQRKVINDNPEQSYSRTKDIVRSLGDLEYMFCSSSLFVNYKLDSKYLFQKI